VNLYRPWRIAGFVITVIAAVAAVGAVGLLVGSLR
jgi:hypothetical protein